MRTDRFLIALGSIVLLVGCRKDRPEEPEAAPIVVGNSGGVYITNEGNFNWGNATVSYYDIATGNAVEDLYGPANGVGMGDVCQSMSLFNGKGYVVVNNSGKVVVVDPRSFIASATITGFNSPRYLLPVNNGKAYVTDLYSDAIAIVDLTTNTISGQIICPGWTEQLVLSYGKAFVTDRERDQVYVIDTATDLIMDSIAVGSPSGSIVEDGNGKLWVLTMGNMGQGIPSALHRIDPITRTIEQSFNFAPGAGPWRLTIDRANGDLYFLDGDVYRMAITASMLPDAAFIPAAGRNFYGLGVDPSNGVLYVSDAIDHVQRGVVYRYATNGTEVGSFLAGITPGGFCFN